MATQKNLSATAISNTWLIIFTDVVALLLTFFVMLFSVSNVKFDRWKEMIDVLSQMLNPAKDVVIVVPTAEYNIANVFRKRAINLEYLYAVADTKLKQDQLLKGSPIVYLDDWIIVSLPGQLMFAPGSATPTEPARQALFNLGGGLRHIDNELGVNGYSEEDDFAGKAYASDWELSLARAIAVANELTKAGYTEDILSFGYGRSRSSALRELPEERRRTLSRGIDIVIKSNGG